MRILLILILFLFCDIIFAQQNRIKFERLTIHDGLSQNTVQCIIKDSKGFMWFGTVDGLNKFNSYTFTHYQKKIGDTSSITSNTITCLFEDSRHRLWIGTRHGGLNLYQRETDNFKSYTHKKNNSKSISGNIINAVYEDAFGNIWVAVSGYGISVLNPATGEFTNYCHKIGDSTSLCSNYIVFITSDSKNNIWLMSNTNKVSRFISGSKTFKEVSPDKIENFKHHNNSKYLLEDSDGDLWVRKPYEGLYFYSHDGLTRKHFSYIHNNNSLNYDIVTTICEFSPGIIWIGTDNGGINIFNKKKKTFDYLTFDPLDPYSIRSNAISSIYKDKEGIIWVGTYDGGVSYYDKRKYKFVHYTANPLDTNSLSHNSVISMFEDSKGQIWIGTDGGGLNRFNPQTGKFIHYKHNPANINSLSSNYITGIAEDSNGNLLVGTYNEGLNVFDQKNNRVTRYTHNPGNVYSIGSNNISTIYIDKKKQIWIGTLGAGINRFYPETGRFTQLECNTSLYTNIYQITGGADNKLYFSTDGAGIGLSDTKHNTCRHFTHNPDDVNSISSYDTRSLFIDSKGRLWIGTRGGGLNMFNTKEENFKHYTIKEGLPGNTILGILEDNSGNLWLSTTHGISKFNINYQKFTNYDRQSGLQSDEFSILAAVKSRSGVMYFGGNNGFNVFYPDSIKSSHHVPKVVITDLKILNKSVPIGKEINGRIILSKNITETQNIELTQEDYIVSIEFAALYYSAPQKCKYAYCLEGFDRDWIYCDANRRYASYSNLRGGHYIFKVKASNTDEIRNQESTVLNINVIPPVWQRTWFIIFIILVIFVLIYAYIKLREKKLQNDKAILEQKVSERTNKISHQKKEIEKQNKELEKHRHHLKQMIKEQTANLIEAKERAEVSSKLKSAFLANMSHEIRTPMNAIVGFLSLLEDEEVSENSRKKYIEAINASCNTLLKLINEILDLSKIEAGQVKITKSLFSVIDLLNEYNNIAEAEKIRENKEHIEIRINIESKEKPLWLWSDPLRFRQILSNLLNNAIKYSETGVIEIGFSMKNGSIYPNKKELSYIEFYVSDTGIGIPEDKLSTIFERFNKVENSRTKLYRGAGLGLAICKRLVGLLGGEIRVESSLGKGSVFYFTLPNIQSENELIKYRTNEILLHNLIK